MFKVCEDAKRKTHFAYFRTIRHFGVVNHGPKWENCPAKKKKKVWRVLDSNEFFFFFLYEAHIGMQRFGLVCLIWSEFL